MGMHVLEMCAETFVVYVTLYPTLTIFSHICHLAIAMSMCLLNLTIVENESETGIFR